MKSNAYKDGRTLKKYYCIVCGKEISISSGLYGSGRCKSCAMQIRLKDPKNHPTFQNYKWNKKYKCKELNCNNQITAQAYFKGLGRCGHCSRIGNRNPCFGLKFPQQSLKMENNKLSYIHGNGYKPYTKEFNKQLKIKIYKRDNYICQKCQKQELSNSNCQCHHIDYNKENCKEENLITLCRKCNLQVNYNRKYWKEFFHAKTPKKNSKKNKR